VQDSPGSKLTRLTTQLSENEPILQAEMATFDIRIKGSGGELHRHLPPLLRVLV